MSLLSDMDCVLLYCLKGADEDELLDVGYSD
jgi:hypothetical protein